MELRNDRLTFPLLALVTALLAILALAIIVATANGLERGMHASPAGIALASIVVFVGVSVMVALAFFGDRLREDD